LAEQVEMASCSTSIHNKNTSSYKQNTMD